MDPDAKQDVDSLLRQAMNNDREALNELFSFYRNRLYRTLLRPGIRFPVPQRGTARFGDYCD
jgi:hypothetical protein